MHKMTPVLNVTNGCLKNLHNLHKTKTVKWSKNLVLWSTNLGHTKLSNCPVGHYNESLHQRHQVQRNTWNPLLFLAIAFSCAPNCISALALSFQFVSSFASFFVTLISGMDKFNNVLATKYEVVTKTCAYYNNCLQISAHIQVKFMTDAWVWSLYFHIVANE